jgi:hypothetical protein
MRTRLALVALATGALALTGCSAKQVDVVATGAQQVTGASNLWWFCHHGRAIYFSNYGSTTNDEYEFLIWDAPECVDTLPEGVTPVAPSVQNIPDDDAG